MRAIDFKKIKPFIAVFIIIFAMLLMVFIKMEVRRMGYIVLKDSREYKILQDRYRLLNINYMKLVRPESVRRMALKGSPLNEAKQGQIIHMTGEQIAVRQ